jgi:hypothetical protein
MRWPKSAKMQGGKLLSARKTYSILNELILKMSD